MWTALAPLLGCLVLLLSACGGDDEPAATSTPAETAAETGASGPADAEPSEASNADTGKPAAAGTSDNVQVAEAVAAAVGGSDPEAACSTSVTTGFVKSAYGDEQGCRAAVEQQGSFSVAVGDVRVDRGAGTAETTAVPDGGPNRGETLTVRLVSEDGTWKVDFLRSDAPAGP